MPGGKTYAFYDTVTALKKSIPFPYTIVAGSVVFWCILIVISYWSYIYIKLFSEINDDTDLHVPCQKFYTRDPESNIQKVMDYPVGDAAPYLKTMEPKKSDLKLVPSAEQSLPFIVTAVESSQFYQVQGLLRHINEELSKVRDINFIIYDVGMSDEERHLIMDQCQCIVRKFQFEAYPDHVQTHTYAWRPLIIQDIMEETGSVIYIEPTTRFKSADSLKMFRNTGTRHFYLWDKPNLESVIGYTHPKMFKYFQEDRCAFLDSTMVSTEIMAFYRTSITWHHLIKPWVICALNEDCIASKGVRANYCFHMRHPKTTGCHRFDQSALSIIANRAYQLTIHRSKYIPPRVTYYTETEEMYFERQPWSYWTIIIVIVVLITIIYKVLKR